jgi:hypothetical protein
MPSPAESFHAAQDTALRGSAALIAAMAIAGKGILTEVAANQPVPYVIFGQNQIILQENEGCGFMAEVFATVSWWSRKTPLDKGAQARAMGAAIIDALLVELTVTGWDVDLWELQQERYVTDPDQSTHGMADFRYLLTQQTA